jgi:hypothetical protein
MSCPVQWERQKHKGMVKKGEYGGCIVYSCMKIE